MEENFILFLFLALPILLLVAICWFIRAVFPKIKERRGFTLICGNFLVLSFLLSVVVLLGELYFRFYYDSTDSFGLCKTTTRWFDRHFVRNQTGFRDSYNYMPTVEPGMRRITFIGDSFTVGHGIPDVEDRFANQVRYLRPDYEVHALAELGWDTGMELELTEFLPNSGYQTDIVVLVYCLNDISDITPAWQTVLDRIYNGPKQGFLATHSYLFNTISARSRMAGEPEIVNYYSFVRKAYTGAIWKQQQQRLKDYHKAVTRSGGELYVVTFPFLHALGLDYDYLDVHKQLDEFWGDLKVPHLDLLEVYDDQNSDELVVSTRDAHPNEKAHGMAAQAIVSFLDEQLNHSAPAGE